MTHDDAIALAALLFTLYLVYRIVRGGVTLTLREVGSDLERAWRTVCAAGLLLLFFVVTTAMLEKMKTHPFFIQLFKANGVNIELGFLALLLIAAIAGFLDSFFETRTKSTAARSKVRSH